MSEITKKGKLNLPVYRIFEVIEQRAKVTQQSGEHPLWEGYADLDDYPWPVQRGVTRTSEQVRTSRLLGSFFTWLVTVRKPDVVVEFGTAFGVSGMYWLAGLEKNNAGKLLTFEPNAIWAKLAEKNLLTISSRFQLTNGTFEENISAKLGDNEKIDIAFIDAIHTSKFVFSQFEIVCNYLSKNGIIVFDGIGFSTDMRECWSTITLDPRVVTAIEVQGTGIVEICM
ncbi:O-methyltransferase [Thiocystis violascens]|uniref:Putative O-methyltransferase n=1 Tax=Thiocystis violascens (strain ATCC 17096 / DSM 198 / 6111) TaxID=765911 RepID=I3YFU6_THIV6|nr:class I SAM-dependent methyltransferase [Thiocystis violascens]AFL75864.1 putative O-methyltransferase [Thiocystis violascens DSM 198]